MILDIISMIHQGYLSIFFPAEPPQPKLESPFYDTFHFVKYFNIITTV